jgi:hypothetical protein
MFCIKIRQRIKRVLQEADEYLDNHVEMALKVTMKLKQLLASPGADLITALIPGTLDDLVKQRLIKALEEVICLLTIADECKEHKDVSERVTCFAKQLQAHAPELRDALLLKMASLLASRLDGNRLKQNLYDLYSQAKYVAIKD